MNQLFLGSPKQSRITSHFSSCSTKSARTWEHFEDDSIAAAIEPVRFKTIAAAFEAIDLADQGRITGPFTLFAPTDEAFARLPKDELAALFGDMRALAALLAYHVVPEQMMAADLVKLDSVRNVQGGLLKIANRGRGWLINGARVLKSDMLCPNGVMHAIDAFLVLPRID